MEIQSFTKIIKAQNKEGSEKYLAPHSKSQNTKIWRQSLETTLFYVTRTPRHQPSQMKRVRFQLIFCKIPQFSYQLQFPKNSAKTTAFSSFFPKQVKLYNSVTLLVYIPWTMLPKMSLSHDLILYQIA